MVAGRFQNPFDFVIIDLRDHRREHHADRHPGLPEAPDDGEPGAGTSRSGLQSAFEFTIEGRHADGDPDQPARGQLRQQVAVAQDQAALGDQDHRLAQVQAGLE